jgi:hypothetical protein
MRCLVCAAEMYLTQVVEDDTMPVPGFEHHTLEPSERLRGRNVADLRFSRGSRL